MSALWLLVILCACVITAAWALSSWQPGDRAWLRDELALAGRVALDLARRERLLVYKLLRLDERRDPVTLGEVSEMIDVVRLGLSAGLSFDASLELFCEQRTSVLSTEFSRSLLAWRIGACTREQGLVRAAHGVGIKALESFALSVAQALELGAPLTDVLAAQSREIRAAHRAQVEREIERAPVKLLIPTGMLILPALLLSILGPLLAASGMV